MIESAKVAMCHEFIEDLPNKYETIVGQHSTSALSGGQIQRVCIARALCIQPSILILDEGTSALDRSTEASVITSLKNLAHERGTIIISVTHRLETTKEADAIFALELGEIAESGNYLELMNKKV